MTTVGVFLHTGYPEATALAREAIDSLEADGHTVRVPESFAKETGLEQWASADEEFLDGLDLVISLGGDGTMLRAVNLVCDSGVPILGVNVGHLGYLTEVEPAGLDEALRRFHAGDHSIQERMTLEIEVESDDGTVTLPRRSAFNEAVVERNAPGHLVRLALSINGQFFTTYAADGLIVATPTGSTAYAMSARGPILSPRLRALLLTPVAPHMLFDRSLVLDGSETIRMELIDGRRATLSVDGQSVAELGPGDAVSCTAGRHAARLVTFGGRDFHQILKAKFGLADR